jgi:hypothetical protein
LNTWTPLETMTNSVHSETAQDPSTETTKDQATNSEQPSDMQTMLAAVSLVDADHQAAHLDPSTVSAMEMEVLEALIAAGGGLDGGTGDVTMADAAGSESQPATDDVANADAPMELANSSSSAVAPIPKDPTPQQELDVPPDVSVDPQPLTTSALASFTAPSSAPAPATPRPTDPPIPIDHALTEPIAAYYKLQFYADPVSGRRRSSVSGEVGEGEEADGFAYYMQTLDATIGRKVVSNRSGRFSDCGQRGRSDDVPFRSPDSTARCVIFQVGTRRILRWRPEC